MSARGHAVATNGGGFGRLGVAEWTAVWATLAVLSACWLLTAGAASGGGARWDRPLAIHIGSLLLWALLSVPLVRLARRVPLHGVAGLARRARALGGKALLGFACALAHGLLLALALAATLPAGQRLAAWIPLSVATLRNNLHFDLLIAGLVLFADEGLGWYRRLEARRVETARLAEQVAVERFAAARLRLRPRFLFRSLAAIAGAISGDPARAERLLLELAALLRGLLESGGDDVATVRDELGFARAYLEVERERLGAAFDYEIDVPEGAALDVELPRPSLQPLLEAAIEAFGEPLAEARVALRCTTAGGRARLAVEVASSRAERELDVVALRDTLDAVRSALERQLEATEITIWCEPSPPARLLAGFEFLPARRAESPAAEPAGGGEEVLWSRS